MFLNPRRTRSGVSRSEAVGFSQGRRRSAARGRASRNWVWATTPTPPGATSTRSPTRGSGTAAHRGLFDPTMSGGQLRLAARTATPRVIDDRGTLNTDTWRETGRAFRALGRP
ncbi:hypothetical protein GCM10010390_42050 [Streptomyces mordarskii]|uniref:Uncharacterized protein n=1 Tax=Streptomyces mordarskii TaxID=1226758 RepID=A0ABP3N6R1_9ACTN